MTFIIATTKKKFNREFSINKRIYFSKNIKIKKILADDRENAE
jgi:hypothetical protein